jgi:hypothetical protein
MAGARKIANRYGSGGDTEERVVCANAVGSGAVRLLKIFRSLRELAMPKFDLGFSAQVTELLLTLLRAQFDRGTLQRSRCVRTPGVQKVLISLPSAITIILPAELRTFVVRHRALG